MDADRWLKVFKGKIGYEKLDKIRTNFYTKDGALMPFTKVLTSLIL